MARAGINCFFIPTQNTYIGYDVIFPDYPDIKVTCNPFVAGWEYGRLQVEGKLLNKTEREFDMVRGVLDAHMVNQRILDYVAMIRKAEEKEGEE